MGSRSRLAWLGLVSLGVHLALMTVQLPSERPLAGTKDYLIRLVTGRAGLYRNDGGTPQPLQTQRIQGPAQVSEAVFPPAPRPYPWPKQKTELATKPAPAPLARRTELPPPKSRPAAAEKQIPHPRPKPAPLHEPPPTPSSGTPATPAAIMLEVDPRSVSVGTSAPAAGRVRRAEPRYAENPRPNYPEIARRKGWAGVVHLRVQVDPAGRVDQLLVNRSSGYPLLDRAARKAVRLWRFVPAREGDRNVASEIIVPVEFRLPDEGSNASPALAR